jgi:hypothetical protein
MVGASSRDIRLTGSFTVSSPIPVSGLANLALFRSVTASSSTDSAYSAVDGDPGTLWAVRTNSPQWLAIDLGSKMDLGRVRIRWDTNSAASYEIQASDDQTNWASLLATSAGRGGVEDILVNGSGRYVRLYVTQSGTGSGFGVREFEVYLAGNHPALPPSNTNVVWVEDSLPLGAIPGSEGGDSWSWVSNNPAPFSGALANQSGLAAGLHQHFFTGATDTLTIHSNDTLVAYVYLDPVNPPTEIMLQWYDSQNSWEHRAYWGANNIGYGVINTPSRRNLGPLPSAAQWSRLAVPASQVGLDGGATLTGMAFTEFDGRATWDYAGKESPAPAAPPIISNLTLSPAGATLTWVSTSGAVYRVMQKSQLTAPFWSDASGDFIATNNRALWLDTNAPSAKQKFYQLIRVR